MTYAVKECFLTLQGEGAQSGSRAVFLRFAGCNLWSGREQDRATAQCTFCDTDFIGTDGEGGGKFGSAGELSDHVAAIWGDAERRLVVVTGGEPMLQLDAALVDALHERGFRIAAESNGTLAATAGIDWLCVSPKAGTEVVQRSGDELKLVWPQEGIEPAELESWDFHYFLVQPMDCVASKAAIEASIRLAMERPKWRLSLQAHKVVGIARSAGRVAGGIRRRLSRRGRACRGLRRMRPARSRLRWCRRSRTIVERLIGGEIDVHVRGHVRGVGGDGVDRGDIVRDDVLRGQILVDVGAV